MQTFLIVLVLILAISLAAILVLFNRQGKRLNEEIQHALDSEDIKSSYLADVSQTFREPLDAILANCKILKENETAKSNPEIKEALENIRHQSRQLYQYTSEILELSNLEGNIPHSTKIQVNLVELILSYRREILYEVKEGVQVKIRTELSPHIKVWLDTTMFRQLILHLLREAALNTYSGYITIRYNIEGKGLRFNIENTCAPIPKEVLETMFTTQIDPYNQDKSKDKEAVISMSICKSIIDSLKGTIEAKSQQDEHGNLNIISFWFPCTISDK